MPFLIFGHRGAPRRFPENTAASFDEALRAGADGFETDLRLCADAVPVLFHDDDRGEDVVETLTSEALAADLVRSLERYAGRTTMILEVKRSAWEDALIDAVSSWQNIVVASFDHSLIAELHRRNVAFDLGLTVFGHIVDLPRYARALGATWIFPGYRYVTAPLVASLHAASMRVVPWTPNRVREWEALRALGCDGVITDLPAEAVEWRNSV